MQDSVVHGYPGHASLTYTGVFLVDTNARLFLGNTSVTSHYIMRETIDSHNNPIMVPMALSQTFQCTGDLGSRMTFRGCTFTGPNSGATFALESGRIVFEACIFKEFNNWLHYRMLTPEYTWGLDGLRRK
eukprot:TRINITY_DN6546_c0_g1_i1.p1 TRINITY_DN6546_c0_g1~~TRINITY_DN6546_c0_g1_i1.p1  ORF type:complete len:130 (-),score=13.73 TRINITY_DN6546_c0_g1_i1:98-487(-)